MTAMTNAVDTCPRCEHPPHEGRVCHHALITEHPTTPAPTPVITGNCPCGRPQKCAKCGRTGMVYGLLSNSSGTFFLCHANPDATKADPDCYTEVTHSPETWWTMSR